MEDLFSATDYLVKNGKSMGIDPDNLVVTGSSAGAITVQQAEWVLCNRAAAGRPGVAGRPSSDARFGGLCDYGHVADALPEGFNYKGIMAFCGPCQIQKALELAGGTSRFYRFPGIN